MTTAWMLLVLLLLPPFQLQTARIIAGESGTGGACPREVQVLIAKLRARQPEQTWYARADPDAGIIGIVTNIDNLVDPCPTAAFLLSREDAESGVLDGMLGAEVGRWECAGGLELRAYAGRE